MRSVLVTGANRGLGLGLVRHLLAEPAIDAVIATARDELAALSCAKLHLIALEVSSEESIERAVQEVAAIVGDRGLDILVNNAGIAYTVMLNGQISKTKVANQFDVNCIAPLLIANKFNPLLKQAAARNGSAQIVNISASLGSLQLAPSMHAQTRAFTISKMSKAALNMLTRMIAIDWKADGIRATSICPGWVKTDLGSEAADLTVDESTIPLIGLILALKEVHNGKFYKHTGEQIEW